MFWEKADFNEIDVNAAFRKRVEKQRRETRKKPKQEYEGLMKMKDLKDQSFKVLQILQKCWQREEIKKRQNLA